MVTGINYAEYLASDDWKRRRKELLRAHGWKCAACGIPRILALWWDREDLNIHHRRYDTLGSESPDDVEALCEKCHGAEHRAEGGRERKDELWWIAAVWAHVVGGQRGKEARIAAEADQFWTLAIECGLDAAELNGAMLRWFAGGRWVLNMDGLRLIFKEAANSRTAEKKQEAEERSLGLPAGIYHVEQVEGERYGVRRIGDASDGKAHVYSARELEP